MSKLNGTGKKLIGVGAVLLIGWVSYNTLGLADARVESAIVATQTKDIKEDISEIRVDIRRILDKLNEE